MDTPAARPSMRVRRIVAGVGLLLLVAGAAAGFLMRREAGRIEAFKAARAADRTAFDNPIVAMELPRSADDVALVIGDRGSADGARMARIQRVDFWFIPTYAALFMILAWLGGHGASPERRLVAILAAVTAAVAAFYDIGENNAILGLIEGGRSSVDAIRRAALVKWTACYATIGIIALLLMTRPYRRERPRILVNAAGILLFFSAFLGLGVWVQPSLVTLGMVLPPVAILLFLLAVIWRPEALDDPVAAPPPVVPDLRMSKPDHLLPIAQAALEEIGRDPGSPLAIAFRQRLEEHATRVKADVPQEVRWELMADLLVRRFPKEVVQRAEAGDGHGPLRSAIREIATETVVRLGDADASASLRRCLEAFGVDDSTLPNDAAAKAPREDELYRRLLVHPSLAARLAEHVGVAVPFALAQQAELDEIAISRRLREDPTADGGPDPAAEAQFQFRLGGAGGLEPRYAPRRAFELDLVGLAFSGGGIRSATFNLGVLQALADLRLLPRIDYLSTVSGGGYIGSWFTSWVKRLRGGVAEVQKPLSPRTSPDPNTPGTRPIRFLREYSSYLTPQRGILGADTWTLVGIWLRNALLVQAVLVLFLSAALLLPIIVGRIALWSEGWGVKAPWVVASFGLGLFFILCLRMATELARFVKSDARRIGQLDESWAPRWKAGLPRVLSTIVAPGFGCALLLALSLRSWARLGTRPPEWLASAGLDGRLWVGIFAAVLFVAGLLIVEFRSGYARSLFRGVQKPQLADPAAVLILATLVPAVVAAALTVGLSSLYGRWAEGRAAWHVVAVGPPLMAIIVGFLLIGHVGLLGRAFTDDRREWFSRLSAWLLIWSAGWLTLFGFAIYSPWAMIALVPWVGKKLAAAGGLAWIAATAWGAYIAQSPSTTSQGEAGAGKSPGWREGVATVAPYVFVVGLLVLISCGLIALLGVIHGIPMGQLFSAKDYWASLGGIDGAALGSLLVILAAATAMLAWRVDVNEFSMHHFYKNRLVRCYLGASREGLKRPRYAHPFTGFDRDDDLYLATLRTDPRLGCHTRCEEVAEDEKAPYLGPLPIVCTALNLVKGDDLAWQERKAQSFVFTPLFSGFEHVPTGEARVTSAPKLAADGMRPTCAYAYPEGGVRLGTAMAISGAAASPNMGYHSSPVTAFLMTMFNVRLGWWMGNPRHHRGWRKSSPTLGLSSLINELTGNTTNRSTFVNLTDGGHFENLGVYELIRRRCRFIVACDAEQDAHFTFGGLGSVVRKCRTDFGVEIEFPAGKIFEAGARAGHRKAHASVAEVRYPGGERGFLLYVKSSLTGDEPWDVEEYARRVTEFPHESTADQWFDESQFESYRQLGYHIAHDVLGPAATRLGSVGPDCWPRIFDDLRPAPSSTAPPAVATPPMGVPPAMADAALPADPQEGG